MCCGTVKWDQTGDPKDPGRKAVVPMHIRARVLASRIMLRMEKNPEAAKALGVKATLREVTQEHSKEIPPPPARPTGP